MPKTKTPAKKNPYDKTSTKRQTSYLERLVEGGGASVRIDFQGSDLAMLDALVEKTPGGSRAEVVRELVRNAHAKLKLAKK